MSGLIKVDINTCHSCPFLNCSDVGEDCNLLKYEIREGEWSNIDYQYGRGWRYAGCPLMKRENLRENTGFEFFDLEKIIDEKIMECEKEIEDIIYNGKDSFIVKHDVAIKKLKELKEYI